MSGQLGMWPEGQLYPEGGVGRQSFRASIAREMRYLLAISTDAGLPGKLGQSGVAHSLGVCLIEDWNMARGSKAGKSRTNAGAMPVFVDIKLSAEDRVVFLAWCSSDTDQVEYLQRFADTGYRVGVSWSGEHQSYTVSVTCRDEESPNNGLCMTSFAKSLSQGIALAWFKHNVVSECEWRGFVPPQEELFG
uniref:Uncharacterized protein n=1 Tax=uncultured prokaryote TaxID=198431 RepID=A0A0H5Q2Q5_9ZZZZ|nr:hypothetical protein [uncultured prokaryote]